MSADVFAPTAAIKGGSHLVAKATPFVNVSKVAGSADGEQEGEGGDDRNGQTSGEHDAKTCEAEHETDGIHGTKGLGFRVAQGDEAMMDVLSVGSENGHATDGAADDCEGCIKDGNAEGDQDDKERGDDGSLV